MTDDEAFVRAIVAAPADDAPRLVYADWLDERGDPRGTYLRAEVEWAVPWRSGLEPALTGQILVLAGGLDPVWVARVSRPPAGVCCTHIHWSDCGPSISESDVADFEHRHGVDLPPEYRAFLLNCNGGRLSLSDRETGYDADYVLFSLGIDDARSLESWVGRRAARFDAEWDRDVNGDPERAREYFLQFINIGLYPDLIHGIHLGVSGPVRGSVEYFDYSVGCWPGYPDSFNPEAATFASFLGKLPCSATVP